MQCNVCRGHAKINDAATKKRFSQRNTFHSYTFSDIKYKRGECEKYFSLTWGRCPDTPGWHHELQDDKQSSDHSPSAEESCRPAAVDTSDHCPGTRHVLHVSPGTSPCPLSAPCQPMRRQIILDDINQSEDSISQWPIRRQYKSFLANQKIVFADLTAHQSAVWPSPSLSSVSAP